MRNATPADGHRGYTRDVPVVVVSPSPSLLSPLSAADDDEGGWVHVDDEDVSAMSEENLFGSRVAGLAYMLLYCAIE